MFLGGPWSRGDEPTCGNVGRRSTLERASISARRAEADAAKESGQYKPRPARNKAFSGRRGGKFARCPLARFEPVYGWLMDEPVGVRPLPTRASSSLGGK
jgi:hypothetical protein